MENGCGSPSSAIHVSSSEKTIWVLDPLTRKLRVPLSLLAPSQATVASGTVPSLCMSFLEGKCRHSWCRQAHVLPSAIADLRRQALNAPTCCARHGDPHGVQVLSSKFTHVSVVDMPLPELIPAECIALTVGLQRFLTQQLAPTAAATGGARLDNNNNNVKVLEIPSRLVCRLHLSHRCRYVEDCNNVHICRDYELALSPTVQLQQTLSGLSASSGVVQINDAPFSVLMLAAGDVSDEFFRNACDEQQKIVAQQPFAFNTSSQIATPVVAPPCYASAALPMASSGSFTVSSVCDSADVCSGSNDASRMQQPAGTPPYGTPVMAAVAFGSLFTGSATRSVGGCSPPLTPLSLPAEAFSNNTSFVGASLTAPPPPPPPPAYCLDTSSPLLAPAAAPWATPAVSVPPPPPPPAAAASQKPMLLRTSVLRIYDVRTPCVQQLTPERLRRGSEAMSSPGQSSGSSSVNTSLAA